MVNAGLKSLSCAGADDAPLRSFLLVQVVGERDFDLALHSDADALVLDLGDWTGARARRRETARRALAEARGAGVRPALFALVAPLESEAIDADLEALISAAPDGVFLAHACGGASVQRLSAKLAVWEAEFGLADGASRIVALAAQTPAAIFRLGSYARASRRLAGLAFDAEALAHSVGADGTTAELSEPFALARSLTLFGAAAAGVAAIDGPSATGTDESDHRRLCEAARREGFGGKLAASASQIRAINEAFASAPATL